MAFLENMLTNNAHATAAMQPQLTPAISEHSLNGYGSVIDGGLGPAAGGFPRGYDGFPGGIGGGGFSPQQPNSGGGMMPGIMNTIQTGFDNLDGAMSGAFDTIKNSLQSKYKTQEALVPNDGGNELQKQLRMGSNMRSPFIDNMNMGMGNAQLQQIHQGNAWGLLGSGYTGSMDQTPPGGIGNAAMNQQQMPLNQGEMAVDATGTQINQDTGMDGQLSQEDLINQLYATMSGQYNGA